MNNIFNALIGTVLPRYVSNVMYCRCYAWFVIGFFDGGRRKGESK
jgi:hypothetical protein